MPEIACLIFISLPLIFILNPHPNSILVHLVLPLSLALYPSSRLSSIVSKCQGAEGRVCLVSGHLFITGCHRDIPGFLFMAPSSPGVILPMPTPRWVPGISTRWLLLCPRRHPSACSEVLPPSWGFVDGHPCSLALALSILLPPCHLSLPQHLGSFLVSKKHFHLLSSSEHLLIPYFP